MAWLLPNAGNKMADDKMRKTLEYILSYNFADTRRVVRCLGGAARRSGGAGGAGRAGSTRVRHSLGQGEAPAGGPQHEPAGPRPAPAAGDVMS